MKQKGFTLIELIAVVVILALIALIVFPAINSVLKDSRDSAYETQIRMIEKAGKEYYLENYNELPDEVEDQCKYVNVQDIIDNGYIADEELNDDKKIINPKNNEPLTGKIQVCYESNQYVYEFQADN